MQSCANCGSSNPVQNRFCAECGQSLSGPTPQMSAAPAASLVAAPVVGIASTRAGASDSVVCSRCRGTNSANMSFCQYCGARLESAADETGEPRRERTRTSPESPAAITSQPPPADAPATAAASPAAQSIRPPTPRPMPPPPAPPSARRPESPAAPSVATGRYAPAELAAVSARLVVIAQDGSPGRDYPLVTEQTDIGRDEGNILLPNDPYVSPRHARILRRGKQFFVQDLDSVNGIFVRLRSPAPLEDGDLVLMGLEVLRFEVVSAADKGYGPATDRDTQLFGSPAAPRYARLCQRTVEGVTRDTYYVTRDETVIGRESGDVVFTGDPFMSRRHAAITREPATNAFSIRDLGSSNGTYLRVRGEREISQGDHVRIGQHLFRLEIASGGQA